MDQSLLGMIEHVTILRTQEENTYKCVDYLSPGYQQAQQARGAVTPSSCLGPISPASSFMNETWREKICEWSYNIVDYFNYDRELVFVCMNYLDRYAMKRRVDTKTYQLAAMTSLFIVMKIYEPRSSSRLLDVSSLTKLSQSTFDERSILAMEREMLQTLQWHLYPPTSRRFTIYLSNFLSSVSSSDTINIPPPPGAKAIEEVNELARFFTELSVCDYFYVTHNASTIGLASLLNAIDVVGEDEFPPEYKLQFIQIVHYETGLNAYSNNSKQCRTRLHATFIQGGFSKQSGSSSAPSSHTNKNSSDDPRLINEEIPSPICVSGSTI